MLTLLLASLLACVGSSSDKPADDTAGDTSVDTADTSSDTGDTSGETGDSGDTGETAVVSDADGDGVDAPKDCDDDDPNVYPGATEVCDGVDDDCDGRRDAEDPDLVGGMEVWVDDDGDGYGTGEPIVDCSVRVGFASEGGDCDDSEPRVSPGAEEVCNGLDDDCEGGVDEGFSVVTYYYDDDGDGYGRDDRTLDACELPRDYALVGGDCSDMDATAYPGAEELCDEVDNNCDGSVDEGVSPPTWYRDFDADGFGAYLDSVEACVQPSGFVADGTDCDDNEATRNPGAPELCDDVDNNCDGTTDEGGVLWYRDSDGDGYGWWRDMVDACDQPEGFVADGTDCVDGDASVNPAAAEECDGVDNNCDGAVDEGC